MIHFIRVWVHTELFSCVQVFATLDFSVHGILQARILEQFAIFSSRGSSWPRDWILLSCIGRWIFFFFFWPLIHLGSPNFVPPSVELKMIRERNDKYFCSKSQGSTLIKDPDYRKGILCKQHNYLDPSKANRGLHHFWGLCVQGQHTKTIGCHGCPVGVSNKEYICGRCLLIVCKV